MFKANNRNTRTRREICSKLTMKIPKRRQWRSSGIFILNFEHTSHLVLVFILLTLSRYMPAGMRGHSHGQKPHTVSLPLTSFKIQ